MIRFSETRIAMGRDRRLKVPDWTLKAGECWVISGAGGSGKSSLARAVAGITGSNGKIPEIAGIERDDPFDRPGAFISFDREKEIREEIRRDDDSEWSGKPDEGSTIENFLGGEAALKLLNPEVASRLTGRGIRNLSTGEFRQVLIAREAGKNSALVVLDEPWEGLDTNARPRLTRMLLEILQNGGLVVITVNREDDIPSFTSGLIRIEDDMASTSNFPEVSGAPPPGSPAIKIPPPAQAPPDTGNLLINMKNVNLAYQGIQVLDDINWTVRAGESWLLTGPNGSGKTSLLNLINGDEPRAYGQDIIVFGRRRGSGESTAWILERMGRVSATLQERVSRHAKTAEVIGSGLQNSLILTNPIDGYESGLVKQWLEILGLSGKAEVPFRQLPYGERRLAMIGRAMIKHPPLLLLDEPMHGLDSKARERVSELIDVLIRETGTSVLFVSHRPEDAPESISRHIQLMPGKNGGPSRTTIK